MEVRIGDDDSGTGWLQVKKKHRSSSKLSLQGWVSGSSGKQSSQGTQASSKFKGRDFQVSHGQNVHKPRVPSSLSSQEKSQNTNGGHKECLDVVSQSKVEDSKLPSTLSKEIVCTVVGNCSVETPHKIKCGVTPKIKWGDLDDDLILQHGKVMESENRPDGDDQVDLVVPLTGDIKKPLIDDTIPSTLGETAAVTSTGMLSGDNSVTESQEIKSTVKTEEATTSPQQVFSLARGDEMFRATVQETNVTLSIAAMDPLGPPECNRSDNGVNRKVEHCELVNDNVSVIDASTSDVLGKAQASESSNCEVSTSSSPFENHAEDDRSLEKKISGNFNGADFHKEQIKSSLAETDPTIANQSLKDSPRLLPTSEAVEGSGSENKERFRKRLWCFLFENLNRAVDELYLLCELECDVEQMKEAIIFLEEAASDFKDLNIRVHNFESPKRPSPDVVDGLPIAMMSDHRRPHALSWEVRRMTTSLHRAEVLASSLEAFKKIQKERNASYSTSQKTGVGPKDYDLPVGSNCTAVSPSRRCDAPPDFVESEKNSKEKRGASNPRKGVLTADRENIDRVKGYHVNSIQNMHAPFRDSSVSNDATTKSFSMNGKNRGLHESCGSELPKNERVLADNMAVKPTRVLDQSKINFNLSDKERDKRDSASCKSLDAWKEKRNWGDILSSSIRGSSRASYTPGMSRKSVERVRVLHDKLMSPDKRRKTAIDMKKEVEEKHARALRIRSELETERVQKLQRTSEKLNRVNEWQADRSTKLREVMHARHKRSISRHEAHLAQVVRKAGDESSKVNEVRFITSLNEENKKFVLRQKLHDSEIRRAEKLQVIKTKQKEDMAREEAVLERRKVLEAEKLQRLAEIQRKKEEAQLRREEERRASSAAREAKAMEQRRKKVIRAKAQQEESEVLAQKLAEKLAESEQRRKIYLEQIREKASMDFRDQSSPLMRRLYNKDNQGRCTSSTNIEESQSNGVSVESNSTSVNGNVALQSLSKKRIKKIRQRLMTLKHELPDPLLNNENIGIGYRTTVGTARAKTGRWLQELQQLRQARKGAGAIGLIISEIIKYVDGKEPELHACRQAGLLDFIASALPASHSPKPDACLTTIYFLRLLKVLLSLPANKSYFLAQNLLPPMIPMLASAIENYTKIAASVNILAGTPPLSSRTSLESLESVSEILDGFLLVVTLIIGFSGSDECQVKMQDELMELLTAYQVIHRLRDLFALYDRPQVEGSPFSSSIILSIELLIVLTSRSTAISSVDLDISSFQSVDNSLVQLVDYNKSAPYLSGRVVGDLRLPPSSLNSTLEMTTSHAVEDISIDETNLFLCNDEADSVNKDAEANKSIANVEKNVNNLKETEPIKDIPDSTATAARQSNNKISSLNPPTVFLLSAISENGLVSLPSLLTAVLLQANNKLSFEQNSYVLPSNFEEVATGVLKVFNNLALVDITFLQKMLSRPDLKMEFFHFMSFLLSHCTSNWKFATDQVGLLLIEALSLIGHFALFHSGNQAVLRWGKSPTILHKVCDLPFVFFSDPQLMPVLAGTLIASCYGCEQNKMVVQLELSVDMVISLLRSCKNGLPEAQGRSISTNKPISDDSQKLQADNFPRSSRSNTKNSRLSFGKSSHLISSSRIGKLRNQKDVKSFRCSEDSSQKQKSPPRETINPLMLHKRFPDSILETAEHFFSIDSCED